MPRYDAATLIKSVERYLDGDPVESAVSEDEANDHALNLPATYQVFQEDVLPKIGYHNAVNKQVPDAKPSILKKVYLKLFSPFLNRQAVFNAETMRGFDILSNHMHQMQQSMVSFRKENESLREELSESKNAIGDLHQLYVQLKYELNSNIESMKNELDELEKKIKVDIQTLQNDLRQDYDNKVHDSIEYINEISTKLDKSNQLIGELRQEMWKQIEFDRNSLNSKFETQNIRINRIDEKYGELARKDEVEWIAPSYKSIEERMGTIEADLRSLGSKQVEISEFRALLNETIRSLESGAANFSATESSVQASPTNPLASIRSKDRDLHYHRFQKEFRGDEKILKQRQQPYISKMKEILKDKSGINALDLACGDGVLVGLQKEAGFNAKGVDSNYYMVEEAKANGLDVVHDDAFKFLKESGDDSYDAISALQFIEHLKPDELESLLSDIYRVLKPNGICLLETLNPHTIQSHKWFHFDLTHQKLVFPEMLELVAKTQGFEIVETKTLNPVEDHQRLKPREGEENWNRLNQFLYGDQDYYCILKKRSASQPAYEI